MTTFITGATGFIGSAVAHQLVDAGESVRALVRPMADLRNIENLPVARIAGDLRDRSSLERGLVGCDALFHLAADYRLWLPRPQELYDTNVEGTRNLLLAAAEAGVKRIVYTSSVATLGLHIDGKPADEDTPSTLTDMVGPYKRSKYQAEELVRSLIAELGLDVVIVSPSTPIGPGDIKPTPTGRIVVEAASGRIPAFVDTGLNIVHVDDVARGHLLAYERGRTGERYILGGENLHLRDVLAMVARMTGQRPPTLRLPRKAIYPIAYAAQAWARLTGGREPLTTVDGLRMAAKKMFFSSAKAERELGYRHRPAEEAIHDAVLWFYSNAYFRCALAPA
jgi:dihydroflavonol-4-reductase